MNNLRYEHSYIIRLRKSDSGLSADTTLENAKKFADHISTYTEEDIVIEDKNGKEVVRRVWHGEDSSHILTNDCLSFGKLGHYSPWRKIYTAEDTNCENYIISLSEDYEIDMRETLQEVEKYVDNNYRNTKEDILVKREEDNKIVARRTWVDTDINVVREKNFMSVEDFDELYDRSIVLDGDYFAPWEEL